MSVNNDSNENDPPTGDAESPSVEQQIDSIAELYLLSLRKGEETSREDLIAKYPDLNPGLESRLKVFEAVFQATRSSAGLSDLEATVVHGGGREDHRRSSESDTPLDTPIETPSQAFDRGEVAKRIDCPHCGNQLQVVTDLYEYVTCGSCGSSVQLDPNSTKSVSTSYLPKHLGRFHVQRLLGQGAFGTVFLAHDPELDRLVALKVPRRGFFSSDEEEQRFLREAKNASQLRHPNIVQIYEVSSDHGTPFIVCEYIDGLTLRDLASSGTLSFDATAKFMIQVADAVEFAHRNGVIHRDLKPSNILVNTHHNCFVTDFGMARRDDLEIAITLDGVILGTPAYMSPEQARAKHRDVDARSDVYSLGVILYRLLCRELPFRGTKRMLIHQVVHDEPRLPRRLNDRIPQDLETITIKAMAKSKNERYQSAAEFADELRRWRSGDPILARPISKLTHFIRACRKHPTVASLCGTIGLLLMAGLILSILWATRESRLKSIADTNARMARENQQQSDTQLYDFLMNNGENSLAQNDLGRSAFWFSNALNVVDNQNNRRRIGMIQDRLPKLTQLWSTGAPASKIRFSKDGSRIAIGSREGMISVYDEQTSIPLLSEKTNGSPLYVTELSPDGQFAITVSNEPNAQLWDIQSGGLSGLLSHSERVTSAVFDDSGEFIITGSDDSFAKIWNTRDGASTAQHEFPGHSVIRVAFVPHSNLALVITSKPTDILHEIQVWDYSKNLIVFKDMVHPMNIRSIEFSKNGETIAAASDDNLIQIWDLKTGKSIGPDGGINTSHVTHQLMFSEDETEIISIGINGDLATWRISDGSRIGASPHSESRSLQAIAVSPRGLIAMGDRDGATRIVWQSDGSDACSLVHTREYPLAIAFHPNQHQIAIGGTDGMVQLWDLAGSVPDSIVLSHNAPVQDAQFTPDGSRCITIGLDGKGIIWNVETGERIGDPIEHAEGIVDFAISSDGRFFVTASLDQTCRIWDCESAEPLSLPLEHDSPVVCVAISPDNQNIATGCFDGSVRGWNVASVADEDNRPLFTSNQESTIHGLAYSHDGNMIATTTSLGVAQCLDSESGAVRFGPLEHPHATSRCEFFSNDQKLIVCGAEGFATIWNLADARIQQRLECSGVVMNAHVSKNGRLIVTSDTLGKNKIWNLVDGTFELASTVSAPAIASAYFADWNGDETLVAIAGGNARADNNTRGNGSAMIWDRIENSMLAPPLPHFRLVRRVDFDRSGNLLLSASHDGTARIWKMTKAELPIAEIQRITAFIAQRNVATGDKIDALSPQDRMIEFAKLSEKYPEFFHCDATEVDRWLESLPPANHP